MRFLAYSFAALLALSFAEAKTGSPVGECPPEDGAEILFLADSEDESIFYRCRGGSPVQMACPDDLTFDLNTKTCIETQVYAPVGKCPSVDGEFAVHLPDSEDRTIFYKCNKGVPVKMECPKGLVFDPLLSVCVFENSKAVTRMDGSCPEIDGDFPTILPDKISCSTYYVCFGGKPFPATCPEGLLFNPEKSYCDFPSNVKCPKNEIQDSEEGDH